MEKKKTPQTFDAFIQKEFGDGIVAPISVLVDKPRQVIPTVLSLDIALTGGIPEGRIVLLSGKPKVGKTSLCLTILRNAIRLGRRASYYDIERRLSQSLLATIPGLDITKLWHVQSTPEKLLSAQDWLQILERDVKDHPGLVAVIDSLPMLCTLAEQTELVGENHDMTGTSKIVASFLRKIKDIADNNNAILIFISQVQSTRDPTSRKKWDEKGGMGIQYACSVWLSADYASLWARADGEEPQGQDVHMTVKCSALGKPYRQCAIPLRYGEGIDEAKDALGRGEDLGLVERSGAWYTIPDLTKDKFCGLEAARKALLDNPELLAALDRQVREAVIASKEPKRPTVSAEAG